jgi:predicted protein tyrosine phosphatase
MNDIERPIVVYHVAAMGNWQEVVREQLLLLRESGLVEVRLTHVGHGLEWVLTEADQLGISVTMVRTDPNLSHYETFAMLEIERLAKSEWTHRPILYLHTKGVSNPNDQGKKWWRRVMQEHVVRRWRDQITHLFEGFDAIGVNWIRTGEQHFSGNFWLASPEWIRRLPDFVGYHHAKGLVRYSCEMWIGSAQWCRAYSLACTDHYFCDPRYDFVNLLPEPPSPGDPVYSVREYASQILVWSREDAEQKRLPLRSAVISFVDTTDQRVEFLDRDHIAARLDIVAHDARDGYGTVSPPTRKQAEDIVDFVRLNSRSNYLVMQCEKGIGRSRAAAIATLWCRGHRAEAENIMQFGTHNRLLCRLICEVAGRPLPPEPLVSLTARVKYSPDRSMGLILSLQRQRYENWELIIVTDGPDSGARDLVAWFNAKGESRLRLIETPEPRGRWGHPYRQVGIDACGGEYIGLTNDDNYYVPGFLEQMIHAIQGYDMVLCDTLHSYIGWQHHHTSPRMGGADLGCFIARASIVRQVRWPGDDQYADGRFIQLLADLVGVPKIAHIPRALFIHN